MATLPDIDTSNVGGITFYNVKDEQGVSDADFDPMDFADWGELENVEIYDNGIDGYIKSAVENGAQQGFDNNNQTTPARFRCKNDGWVILWSTTSNNYFGTSKYDDGTTVDTVGDYNFYGILIDDAPWTMIESALSHAGYGVSPASSGTVFGHYNFKTPEASNLTVCTVGSGELSWSFTSSVDRKLHYGMMSHYDGTAPNLLSDSSGNAIVSSDTASSPDDDVHTALDLLNEQAQGWTFTDTIDAGTTYTSKSAFIDGTEMVSTWS